MGLFTSEDDLRLQQRRSANDKDIRDLTPSADQQRQEWLDDQRELREQARWRSLGYFLFIVPVVSGLLFATIQLLLPLLAAAHTR